ncbi:MAG: polysaccharide deacetylase family protein [Bacilli bacterium]
MKKFFQILGILTLFIISFFYTEKAIIVVRQLDDIMIKIKEEKSKYETKPIDAIIINDEIIPGLWGQKVVENKSYLNMKRVGQFNPHFFEYEKVKPDISYSNNINKYVISGNEQKNSISLVFLVKEETNVLDVVDILKQKNIKGNFFINDKWLEKNHHTVHKIIENGNVLGNLNSDTPNMTVNFTWLDTIIKQLTKQKYSYCYMNQKNKKNLELCAVYKNYTIMPTLIIKSSPLKEIKEKAKFGSIIAFPIDDNVLDELGTTINYLKAKGFKIVTLKEHLSEEINSND